MSKKEQIDSEKEAEQTLSKKDNFRRVGMAFAISCVLMGLIICVYLDAYSKEQQKMPETLADVAYIECDCKYGSITRGTFPEGTPKLAAGEKAFRFFETGDEFVTDYCGRCGADVMEHGIVVFHEGRKCKDCGAIANETYCEACGNYVFDTYLSDITYSDK